MDAIVYFCAIVSIGVGGFLVGRAQRERRYRAESAANLARSVAHSHQRRNARAHANRLAVSQPDDDSVPGSNSDGDSDSESVAVVRQAGRRAIHGANGGHRSYSGPPNGARRGADEKALAVAGYDC